MIQATIEFLSLPTKSKVRIKFHLALPSRGFLWWQIQALLSPTGGWGQGGQQPLATFLTWIQLFWQPFWAFLCLRSNRKSTESKPSLKCRNRVSLCPRLIPDSLGISVLPKNWTHTTASEKYRSQSPEIRTVYLPSMKDEIRAPRILP